jgi:uncharacterized protein YjlB
MSNDHRVDTLEYTGEDFQPVVETSSWITALMNWSPRFDHSAPRIVEAHSTTDEVFVLLRGKSVLFVSNEEGLTAIDMLPGVVYNVTRGTYHGVIGSRDVQWLIVESPYDPAVPTQYRQLDELECRELEARCPNWLMTDGE